jgi:hypothetical protein
MAISTQIVKTGRRIVFRILAWNHWLPTFFRLLDQLCPSGKPAWNGGADLLA